MMCRNKLLGASVWKVLFLCVGLLLWVIGQSTVKPGRTVDQMEIAPPVPIFLLTCLGDRYLAANVATWRSTVLGGVNLPDFTLAALAKIQEDASWLNPWQEDNYYTASAILPWEGYVETTQLILARAIKVRENDPLPPFYYALYKLGFEGDVIGAAKALRVASVYVGDDVGAREYFLDLATSWEKTRGDVSFALAVMKKMAKGSRSKSLATFLEKQVTRVQGLALLNRAAEQFEQKFGRVPVGLPELQEKGILANLPSDPTGIGYGMKDGQVVLLSKRREGDF